MIRYQLPVPSTSLSSEVEFVDRESGVSLIFFYELQGIQHRVELRFEKTRAYRHRAEVHCTVWQIETGYGRLVEIPDSDWAKEIHRDTSSTWKDYWTLRHFLIYFDSTGCFEVLAGSWEVVDEAVA